MKISAARCDALKPPIALSMGDVCGIGPEIIVRSYVQHPELLRQCVVIGDVQVLNRAGDLLLL
ncbi:MAG: hypothetical protein MUE54_13405, partial [Anaerolineae bacterium]|nr:hypothetical protein [Anaerolineae bacterium]